MADQLPLYEGGDPEGSANTDDEGQGGDLRTVELTSREVSLLLKYGYPFRDQEQKLRSSKAVEGIHRVRLGAYWIELMLGDLARSEREIRSRRLLDEFDELYSVLESALEQWSRDATAISARRLAVCGRCGYSGTLEAQCPVNRVEVKPFRIEGSADPGEHFIVTRTEFHLYPCPKFRDHL